jgi:hypothetical protein
VFGVGSSVTVTDDLIAVGGGGYVYVYTKTAQGWRPTADLAGPGSEPWYDAFAQSIAASGTTIAVADSSQCGPYLFTKAAGGRYGATQLTFSDSVNGDGWGYVISMSSGTIAVGAPAAGPGGPLTDGRVYVFARTPAGWRQTAELKSPNPSDALAFGESAAVSGSTLAVGDRGTSNLYLYTRTPSGWRLSGQVEDPHSRGAWVEWDCFGWSSAIAGPDLVVGADCADSYAGRAYVFPS